MFKINVQVAGRTRRTQNAGSGFRIARCSQSRITILTIIINTTHYTHPLSLIAIHFN